mgnify:CR=1 FL=1
MSDITPFIQAKADQLNADDLVGGPIVARIVEVRIVGGLEQPVAVILDGDHKPWKPCKTSMRILAAMWGTDSSKWAGRTVRLFRDPTVKYGGVEVGGIRISGMSDVDGPKTVTLASSKKTKTTYRIEPLRSVQTPQAPKAEVTPRVEQEPAADGRVDALRANLTAILSATPFECAPSNLATYLKESTGKPVPPVAQWDAARLEWAVRAMSGQTGRDFAAWLNAGPSNLDASPFDPEDVL